MVNQTVETMPCAHCGRIMGDPAGGYASVNRFPLCHPNDPARPDCYVMVTVKGHQLADCPVCRDPDACRCSHARGLHEGGGRCSNRVCGCTAYRERGEDAPH